MNNELARYIINYFPHLLTNNERRAIRHSSSIVKLNEVSNRISREKIYREKGWITSDLNVLDLLKDGYESFLLNTTKRIMSEDFEKLFLNNCPKCNKLARTPKAKQCRHCGFSWHN